MDKAVEVLPCSRDLCRRGPAPIHKRIKPKKWVRAEPGSLMLIEIVILNILEIWK